MRKFYTASFTFIPFTKMKKSTLIAIASAMLLTVCPGNIYGQKKSSNDDYNLKKAYEVLQEQKDESKALELLRDQLNETPDNVAALMLRARVLRNRREFGNALADVNHAIKVNKPKKSEYFNSTLWYWKATLYDDLGEWEKSADAFVTALSLAKKDNRDNVQTISFDYAQVLYQLKRYDEADAVYREMLAADETDQAAMVGLARNLIENKKYKEAVELCEKSIKFDEDYSGSYKFAMQAYDGMGETDKAIDNAIRLLEKDEDELTQAVIDVFFKHRTYATAKIKEANNKENNIKWQLALISIYSKANEYEKVIQEYNALEKEYGHDEVIYYQRSMCYNDLGMVQTAIAEINKAIELKSDYSNWAQLGTIYREDGKYEDAIKAFDKVIELIPTNAWGYYIKGWCYELSGDDDTAMKLYEEGIDIDKEYPYIFLMRGQQYLKRGDIEKGNADFETVLKLDTLAVDGSCRQYALHFLGRDEEAQTWMEKIIEAEPDDAGHWYDQSCLFSRMGRCDEAVKALEKCFEMGYCKFAHIEHDDDLDNIRNREDFKGLIEKYSARLEERIAKLREEVGEPKEALLTEVPITRHAGGTFEIPCSVNGLNLNMLFDTGASDVTISSVEANFMLKNNYLSKDDIKGKNYYQIANGDLVEGTIVTLREVKVGEALLRNVDASVVKSQKAPLLLGQSVMERFGTITIDNINSKIIIKQ